MYEIYLKLLEEKGVKTADVCRETGIPASTFSDWKKGKSAPKQEKLIKIAEYFGVSLDYLATGGEPELDKFSQESAILVSKVRNDAELSKALLKYFELSSEKKKHVIEMINLLSGDKA